MPAGKKELQKNKNSIQNAKNSKKEDKTDAPKTGLVKDEKFVKDDGTVVRKSLFTYNTYEDGESKKDSSDKEANKKIIKVKGGVEVKQGNKKYALSENPPQAEMKKNK